MKFFVYYNDKCFPSYLQGLKIPIMHHRSLPCFKSLCPIPFNCYNLSHSWENYCSIPENMLLCSPAMLTSLPCQPDAHLGHQNTADPSCPRQQVNEAGTQCALCPHRNFLTKGSASDFLIVASFLHLCFLDVSNPWELETSPVRIQPLPPISQAFLSNTPYVHNLLLFTFFNDKLFSI